MADLTPDQQPDAWSSSAAGYDEAFAGFTGPYADSLLDATGLSEDHDVLDVAAGTGALTLRAARRGAKSVHGTDFAPGMVAALEERLAAEGHDAARAEVMDGQALTVDDASYDRAYSLFGLIFFPDADRGFAELHRALRSGGRVGVATWNLAVFPMAGIILETLSEAVEGFEPPTEPPAWARIGDAATLADHLERAGFSDAEVHEVSHDWMVDDPRAFFIDIPSWSPPLAPLFEILADEQIQHAADAFDRAVHRALGDRDGIETGALLGVGTR